MNPMANFKVKGLKKQQVRSPEGSMNQDSIWWIVQKGPVSAKLLRVYAQIMNLNSLTNMSSNSSLGRVVFHLLGAGSFEPSKMFDPQILCNT